MTFTRLLPFQLHAALEALMAPAIIAVPFALGFAPVALVGAILLGGLVMGSALHGSARIPRVSTHAGLDLLAAIAAGGGAVGLALVGEPAAATFFVAVAALQALLSVSTRYTTDAG